MNVFITGGTGYVGRRLIPELHRRGHSVRALARPSSIGKLPSGCTPIAGDPLAGATFADRIAPATTLVHLVGVPRPAPWKGPQFRRVDLPSAQASLAAARSAGASHFVYVSVAQPAPVMKAYLAVRAECEGLIHASGLHATILRPWYILGPGHYWPMALVPIYRLLERFPQTREAARRLGLVTVEDVTAALILAIEHPPGGIRLMEVPEIRAAAAQAARDGSLK